jgi:hypothetical protein
MNEARAANALLVGKLLAATGATLALFALVTWAGWLPFSPPAARALALIFAVTAAVDLLIAFFFVALHRR